MPHLLALSQNYVDLITSPPMRKFVKGCLETSEIRLKNQRYYETYGGHPQSWHTDDFAFGRKVPNEGLVFVIYMDDTNEGEFQLIKNSKEWAKSFDFNNYDETLFPMDFVENIVSFPGKKGALIIFNSKLVHRAKQVSRKSFVRKSILFHFDQGNENGEHLLINPALLKAHDKETLQILGFGNEMLFPNLRSSPATLPINRLFDVIDLRYARSRFIRFVYEFLLGTRILKPIISKLKTTLRT